MKYQALRVALLGCCLIASSVASAQDRVGVPGSVIVPPNAVQTAVKQDRGRQVKRLKSDQEEFGVDVQTGILILYYDWKGMQRKAAKPEPVALSLEQAVQSARTFLLNLGLYTSPRWELDEVFPRDIDEDNRHEYDLIFVSRVGQVYLPFQCYARVDAATGKVLSYGLTDDPVVVPLAWRISAEDAIAAVVADRKWSRWEVEDIRLRVSYKRFLLPEEFTLADQILIWQVQLRNSDVPHGKDSYAHAEVDPNTGAIIRYRYLAGQPSTFTAAQKAAGKKKLAQQPKPNLSRPLKAPPTVFQLAKQRKTGAIAPTPPKS